MRSGRELEAIAARTIAERGVQLIGTAHGNTLENLLMNPTLSDLVGGIDTVTLSDEEARRRGTQKTVLERKAPPTFDVLIEIQERQRMIVHHKVADAVDSLLRGWTLSPEIRYVNSDRQVHIESVESHEQSGRIGQSRQSPDSARRRQRGGRRDERDAQMAENLHGSPAQPNGDGKPKAVRVFPYGIGQNRLRTAAQNLKVPVEVVKELRDADIVMTLKNYFRQKPQPIADAERRNVPVYVLRSNTVTQMEQYLLDVFQLRRDDPDVIFDSAMRETQNAIQRLLKGEKSVELSPQAASIRSQQHQLARTANLISHQLRARTPPLRAHLHPVMSAGRENTMSR